MVALRGETRTLNLEVWTVRRDDRRWNVESISVCVCVWREEDEEEERGTTRGETEYSEPLYIPSVTVLIVCK